MKVFMFAALAIVAMVAVSCSDESIEPEAQEQQVEQKLNAKSIAATDSLKANFAMALSAALSNSCEFREFLKGKALEQFDRNYDVLFLAVKDQKVGGCTFRNVIKRYMTEETLSDVEKQIPLLNIYLTRFAPLGVYPEELDTSDEEIPTAVVMHDSTRIFVNGKQVETIAKDDIPDFHMFVVGENKRVEIDDAKNCGLKTISSQGFRFKDPSFDGSNDSIYNGLKSIYQKRTNVGEKALAAYRYFNKNDNSIYQKGLQRDYIYYGITPKQQKGNIDHSVSEHICRIKVDPKSFFKIRDHVEDKKLREDPDVINSSVLSVGHTLKTEDLINKMWSEGVYDFRFDVVKSNEGNAETVYISARPEDIWDFHIEHWYRHKTSFRHSRHHYSIDPKKFTVKEYTPELIPNIGKWDISEEALHRYISIWEEDKGTEIEDKYTYDMTIVKKTHFSGDMKLTLGLGKSSNSSVETKVNVTTDKSETESIKREVSIKRKDNSDYLGKVAVYFYDPIIEGVDGENYLIHEYSTGTISFCVVAY